MSNVRSHELTMTRWLLTVALMCLVLSAKAQTGDPLLRAAHVQYSPPTGWTVEDFPDHRGTLMYKEAEPNQVAASIGIELSTSADRESITEILERIANSRASTREGHKELSRSIGKTHGGATFGRVEFSQVFKGVRTIDSFAVLPLRTGPSVYVYTSIAEVDYPRYSRTVSEFLKSLGVPQ
jgi:hypothetical protein